MFLDYIFIHIILRWMKVYTTENLKCPSLLMQLFYNIFSLFASYYARNIPACSVGCQRLLRKHLRTNLVLAKISPVNTITRKRNSKIISFMMSRSSTCEDWGFSICGGWLEGQWIGECVLPDHLIILDSHRSEAGSARQSCWLCWTGGGGLIGQDRGGIGHLHGARGGGGVAAQNRDWAKGQLCKCIYMFSSVQYMCTSN